jgi:hypothetical protein
MEHLQNCILLRYKGHREVSSFRFIWHTVILFSLIGSIMPIT